MSSPILVRSPQQGNLFREPDDNRTPAAGLDRFILGNREAARIILASPSKYSGLMSEWARLVLGGDR